MNISMECQTLSDRCVLPAKNTHPGGTINLRLIFQLMRAGGCTMTKDLPAVMQFHESNDVSWKKSDDVAWLLAREIQ